MFSDHLISRLNVAYNITVKVMGTATSRSFSHTYFSKTLKNKTLLFFYYHRLSK